MAWKVRGAAWVVACAACTSPAQERQLAATPTATQPAAVGLAAPPDGQRRLSANIKPLHYELRLRIDPRKSTFSGLTRIAVNLRSASRRIELHARDLEVSSAIAIVGDKQLTAKLTTGARAGLALDFETEIAGDAIVELEYSAPLTESPESLYRAQEGDRWYAFTQFEALMARQAFPCFDEPGFKTPFQVTLEAPEGMVAVSNTPSVATSTAAPDGDVPYVAHEFAKTTPLPTYLIAFAVGEFDVIDAPIQRLPHRLLTTKGKGHQTAYAAQRTPVILEALTDYFGTPYPFAKLDQVAVPSFSAGAMENVGLVTYRESLLLLDPATASSRDKLSSQSVIAHELAHMWFGNLVTMKWWDDLWLNEAFATWMSNKVLTRIAPELEPELGAVSSMLEVMDADALSSANPIRKVIDSDGDINNAFDRITYEKGFAVLRMLEQWLGADQFQAGIRLYLDRHAWGNATMEDFMAAMEEVSQEPVKRVANEFVTLAGTPLVSVTRECNGNTPRIRVRQGRYVPGGVEPTAPQSWNIPVCMRLLNEGQHSRTECVLLTQAEQVVELAGAVCPEAIHPNAAEAGYYHWQVPSKELVILAHRHYSALGAAERVALPAHATALFEANLLNAEDYLAVLTASGQDEHRLVLAGVLRGLELLRQVLLEPEREEVLRPFATQLLEPHLKRIGLEPRPGEGAAQGLLRASLVDAYSRLTNDEEVYAAAERTTARFLVDPTGVLDEQLQLLLPIRARQGDAELYEALLNRFKSVDTPTRRNTLLFALGSFNDSDLLKRSYDHLLDGTFRITDGHLLRRAYYESERRHQAYWEWFLQNEQELIVKVGPDASQYLPWVVAGLCHPDARAKAREHFANLERFGDGAAHNLAQALEHVDRCIHLRTERRSELLKALRSR